MTDPFHFLASLIPQAFRYPGPHRCVQLRPQECRLFFGDILRWPPTGTTPTIQFKLASFLNFQFFLPETRQNVAPDPVDYSDRDRLLWKPKSALVHYAFSCFCCNDYKHHKSPSLCKTLERTRPWDQFHVIKRIISNPYIIISSCIIG